MEAKWSFIIIREIDRSKSDTQRLWREENKNPSITTKNLPGDGMIKETYKHTHTHTAMPA
jgi:hypothetical protein